MKQVKELPTEGQFVAVWEDDGEIFTDKFCWANGNVTGVYGCFMSGSTEERLREFNAIYYIAE